MHRNRGIMVGASILVSAAWGGLASAQTTNAAAAPQSASGQSAAAPQSAAPPWIDLYFTTGSSTIRPQDQAKLDKASRTFTEGKPIVMIVAGSTDRTGSPEANLKLSEARATVVLQQLVARGIPVQRLQLLAEGVSDPAVPDSTDKSEQRDRRVQISWR